MKSFSKYISEVAQPRERGAEEEQAFKDQHTYEVIPHPVALDTQFTGDIQKPQAMRPADNKGDHTYDKAYAANVTGFEEFDESVETLDEDKSEEAADQHEYETDEHRDHADDHAKAAKMHAAKAKSSKDSSVANKHKAASAAHDKAREHALDAAHHHQAAADAHRDKDSGAKKATKTADHHTSLHYAASEKADAHSSKLTEEVVAETTSSAIKRPVTTTGPDGKTRTVFKKAKVDRTDDRGQDVIVGEGIVNELSKKTLGSYIKKATGDVQKSSGKAGYASGKGVNKSEYDRQTDNAEKRTAGINKATNKLVGESFTEMLDEAVKIGNLRLKDGKSVKVSAQDAKLLNQFYKDLNAKNRRDMEKVMMKDTSGFEEIVGFAREAL